ncbi:J domain-containing protein [Cyanobium sp. WKJ7-Wakatipu]|uniref:J domain-containing protein n=1 Tax=Cyanobium sp. WKJ7-Wakatipu TaxID=2823726 RepID=UPI0020CEBD2E|nr:J domain-containing protein [Cyanobium sp. WKJ7-Wakatipu]MCP9784144.1 J domain-containing protein [Cyanobium sp. WKJ7-Wakatipu]
MSFDLNQLRDQAHDHHAAFLAITFQVERLTAENTALKLQVAQLLTAGAELSPATARAWQVRFEQFPAWAALTVGNSRWDAAAGKPEGSGLQALRAELMAVPMTGIDRSFWDRKEAKRVADAKARGFTTTPARPAPDRKPGAFAISWELDQKHPGLGKSLEALTTGLRGRLKLVIELAFLIYGTEAVERLTNNPELVLTEIRDRCWALDGNGFADAWARMKEVLNGAQDQKREACAVLGVDASASPEAIKIAYRQLAKQHHPDTANGNAETFARVASAYEVLVA